MVKNQKGFTLVEVIVVAVIVAILAAVAIPFYNSYIRDSAQNVCENTASSAASFLGAARAGSTDFIGNEPTTRNEGENWTYHSHQNNDNNLIWVCPVSAQLVISGNDATCIVTKGSVTKTSKAYPF